MNNLPSLEEWAKSAEKRKAHLNKLLSEHATQQIKSMGEQDQLLTVTYADYKKLYPNAESVWGSFKDDMVQIIIRHNEGRHYHYYTFSNGTEQLTFKAMKVENARKRLPVGQWELILTK